MKPKWKPGRMAEARFKLVRPVRMSSIFEAYPTVGWERIGFLIECERIAKHKQRMGAK